MRKIHKPATARALPYIFILMFIAGVSAGSLFARFSAENPVANIFTAPKLSIFVRSATSFFKPCFLIWIFGFSGISEYISAGVLAYRGAVFGFVNTCFFKELGVTGGLGAALAASLPQNMLFFPFLLILGLAAARYREWKNSANYFGILFVSILICAFSAVIDTFITSYFINSLL